MAAEPKVIAQLKGTGLGSLTPAQGLDALAGVLGSASVHWPPLIAAVLVDWSIVLKKVLLLYAIHFIVFVAIFFALLRIATPIA